MVLTGVTAGAVLALCAWIRRALEAGKGGGALLGGRVRVRKLYNHGSGFGLLPLDARAMAPLSLTALWAAEEEREPLTLTLLVNADSASKPAIAQYLAQSLSVEGLLQVTVEALAWTDYLEALAGGDFDLYYGEVRLTADWDISELIGTGGELNYGGWSAVDTDAMLEACRAGGENAYRNLCRHLREAVPLLPVCFKSDSLLTHSGAVENARPTAANIFYNFPDWVLHFAQPAEESAP